MASATQRVQRPHSKHRRRRTRDVPQWVRDVAIVLPKPERRQDLSGWAPGEIVEVYGK